MFFALTNRPDSLFHLLAARFVKSLSLGSIRLYFSCKLWPFFRSRFSSGRFRKLRDMVCMVLDLIHLDHVAPFATFLQGGKTEVD